jgi:hypothetical protein
MFGYHALEPAAFSWTASEVVKDLDDRPHLLVKLEITGPYFPERAAEPFARVVRPDGRSITCWFADVSDDQRRLKAYFTSEVPPSGTIEFGYGQKVLGRLPADFDRTRVRALDRDRLPRHVVVAREAHVRERPR